MTSHTKRNTNRRKAKSHAPAKKSGSDAAVYLGLAMIGAFAVLLAWFLFQHLMDWTHVLVGYLIAMAVLTNLYAWQAFLGRKLANWQQAMARVPMRIAGYGTRGGKPISAARGQPDAKMTLMLFGAGCVVLIAVVSMLLIQP